MSEIPRSAKLELENRINTVIHNFILEYKLRPKIVSLSWEYSESHKTIVPNIVLTLEKV